MTSEQMTKSTKRVLVVDDEEIREIVVLAFTRRNNSSGPYHFVVDMAAKPGEAIDKLRETRYDVVILDVKMEIATEGLEIAHALTMQYGVERPVKIMFSGQYRDIATSVEAQQDGAWDYILKGEMVGGKGNSVDRVVDSAIERLMMLDLSESLEKSVQEWLVSHAYELEMDYPGKHIALWHEPVVSVIASGRDAFELDQNLKSWREDHFNWQQPYLLAIPSRL